MSRRGWIRSGDGVVDACTGQHAFRDGVATRGSRDARQEHDALSEYGLTVFVDGPSARYDDPCAHWYGGAKARVV